ncbi:serine/threonine-protein kinase KIN2 [Xylographa opegraphella]|nr:serine/threonine-protein kinase KIN2 [Xylographa opegraphella]
MSAATAPMSTIARNGSRRQQSYTSPTSERQQRTPSSAARSSATPAELPIRSDSQAYSHGRAPSASQQPLAVVARRDHETSNLARPPSSRRSSSRDRSYMTATSTTRADSGRVNHRSHSRPSNSRYTSEITGTSDAGTNGASATIPTSSSGAPAQGVQAPVKRRTTIGAQTGQWSLGKTIGAGSMGKVKIAKNLETGEQVAIKIVPRQSTDEHHSVRDRERADHSKEIRTAREAAIVTLLNHPYICGMRDVVRTNYHWYMLFEYVNGGQMLDYIISHGRLKEKQARKFGRQIASALDYCHRNSIVHRDLKIENILISKTGDIKIIDFGLSNLFSPRNHLKTFCGSLYFAAPELLQARQYTGPEVDIWSFGIVLYVLVCGKVPFDDQSMPQLHAKIKKGVVDYPAWLSAECKNLISRMLVTDPKQRATLSEIMNHPWITKGFNTPPENYLPHREPLQLPLDDSVVQKMTGFDFGSSEYITTELIRVIESDEYQSAVRTTARDGLNNIANNEKKRGVFDFYKRRNSTTSRDTLPNMSAEAVQLGSDPVNAFSPLISIYYLVREKQERERTEPNPGALSMPISPGEKPLRIPELPPPPPAYTNATTYEMPGEKITGGRSRPRARTQGEDDIEAGVKKLHLASGSISPAILTTPAPQQTTTKRESMAGGILRRFSTRRNKESTKERFDPPAPSLQLQTPTDTAAPPRKSFSVRRSRNKESLLSPMIHSTGSQQQQPDLLTPPASAGVVARAGSKILGRSTSVNSADYSRRQSHRGVSETAPIIDPPMTSGSDRSSFSVGVNNPKVRINEPSPTEPKSGLNTRTPNTRTKSLGHARRESIQARRARRGEARTSNVPEETSKELVTGDELTDIGEGTDQMKPVYLKGLFSVSTTSNKPLPFIRADIIRVLKQLGVTFSEIKGGFSCRHAPSIDLNRVSEKSPSSPDRLGLTSPSHRRRISFGGFMGGGDRERDETRDLEKSPQMHRSTPRRRGPDASFTNSEDSDDEIHRRPNDRPAGETTTHVENDLGENMVLKFEIFIVKVPLFSLHGIQFKKVSGGTWQYKNMAQKILDALRL